MEAPGIRPGKKKSDMIQSFIWQIKELTEGYRGMVWEDSGQFSLLVCPGCVPDCVIPGLKYPASSAVECLHILEVPGPGAHSADSS